MMTNDDDDDEDERWVVNVWVSVMVVVIRQWVGADGDRAGGRRPGG